jgi:hypothetical protein
VAAAVTGGYTLFWPKVRDHAEFGRGLHSGRSVARHSARSDSSTDPVTLPLVGGEIPPLGSPVRQDAFVEVFPSLIRPEHQ